MRQPWCVQLFEDVYQNYRDTLANGGRVSSVDATADLAAVRKGLPDLFRSLVESTGRDSRGYRLYGSVGQRNWSYAKIPWVAICDRRVTRSTEHGYYIVLLFREILDGCFLSLNQGVTQFKRTFGTDELAAAQIQVSAEQCLRFLDIENPFIAGQIDLAASRPMGKAYERGAIASKWYPQMAKVDEGEALADLTYLLELYDRLIHRLGPDLSLKVGVSEATFQQAAASIARNVREIPEPPPGPLPPPPRIGVGSIGYRRDPSVAALAQQQAGFRCEVDSAHLTFTSRVSKDNFVECHHLIPMSLQPEFRVSLDIVENIVVLCPTCHRLLHHGLPVEKTPLLRELVQRRQVALQSRGVFVEFKRLVKEYGAELPDGT